MKSACVSGHRVLPPDFPLDRLTSILEESVQEGFRTFYIGMAMGFDLLCFEVLLKLKERYPDLSLIACVPCGNQTASFPNAEKKRHAALLQQANETVILAQEYEAGCMQRRNRYMVDHSERVICYLNHTGGGTYYTVHYAVEKGKEVVYLR